MSRKLIDTLEMNPYRDYGREPNPYWAYGQNPAALAHIVIGHGPQRQRQKTVCHKWIVQSEAPHTTPSKLFRCRPCEVYAIDNDIRGIYDQNDDFSWERGY